MMERAPTPTEMRKMPGEREPVARAIDVLVWMADHPTDAWSVRQVAREMDAFPSTIHRIFQLFESRNLVSRTSEGRYSPGLELFRISQVFSRRLSPVPIARPHLERLAETCGETVLLAAFGAKRGQMMFIDMIQAPHPLRWVVELNQWMAVHSGATGLAMLAFLPEAERTALYRGQLDRFTDRTLTEPDDIERETERIREQGYACSRGQRIMGAVGLAAPIFDAAGAVFGDVCITIPEGRFDERLEPGLGRLLVSAAAEITSDLRAAGFLRDS